MEMLKYDSGEGLQEINSESCPCIMKLISFRNTIASTSAEAERSFSAMNRLKNRLRSLLSDERTSDLTLLSFEYFMIILFKCRTIVVRVKWRRGGDEMGVW